LVAGVHRSGSAAPPIDSDRSNITNMLTFLISETLLDPVQSGSWHVADW
jgi:hypothetical protein